MNGQSKRRTSEHIIDSKAQKQLEALLPDEWVIRSYRPDYGLDFDVEIFEKPKPAGPGAPQHFETLGEHILIQLKGTERAEKRSIDLHQRMNVEKYQLSRPKTPPEGTMEVVSFSLDVSELVTIQRMGAAIPVLLVVCDIKTKESYFVCLNDYIEKILLPEDSSFSEGKSRTIHIPTANRLDSTIGLYAMRWYAKRAKLYAAFQKFVFQEGELSYAGGIDEVKELARHFGRVLARYDFWNDCPAWALIGYYGSAINRFLKTGSPGILKRNEEAIRAFKDQKSDMGVSYETWLDIQEIMQVWNGLAALPKTFEELCREWFLPTLLGKEASYP